MKLRSWMLMLALAAAGCGKRAKTEDGPSCRQIVSYMMRFKELGAFDERGAIADCRKQNWNAEQRRCLYTAKDVDSMIKCVPPIPLDPAAKKKLPLPEWHPDLSQPLRGKVEHRPGEIDSPPGPATPAAGDAVAPSAGAGDAPKPPQSGAMMPEGGAMKPEGGGAAPK